MATFFVRTDNASFQTKTEIAEVTDAAAALAVGVRGAIFMAADDISRGEPTAAVVIGVEDGLGAELLRSAVMVSVAPLTVRETEQDN